MTTNQLDKGNYLVSIIRSINDVLSKINWNRNNGNADVITVNLPNDKEIIDTIYDTLCTILKDKQKQFEEL